jgi:hypothetical protein
MKSREIIHVGGRGRTSEHEKKLVALYAMKGDM